MEYATEQLLRMALTDLEKGGWEVDHLDLTGARSWGSTSRRAGVRAIFAFMPEEGVLGLRFIAHARYTFNNQARAFLTLLHSTLSDRGITLEWEAPRSFMVTWEVRDPNLWLTRGVAALRDEVKKQLDEGHEIVLSCLHALRSCALLSKRQKVLRRTTLKPRNLVAFVGQGRPINLPQYH